MKQPRLRIELFVANPDYNESGKPEYLCNVCDGMDYVEVAVAMTKNTAYRIAARRLRKLADKFEKLGAQDE